MKILFAFMLILVMVAVPKASGTVDRFVSCEKFNYDLIQLIVNYASNEGSKAELAESINMVIWLRADQKRYLIMLEKVFNFPRPSVDAEFDAIYDAVAEQCEVT